MLPGVGLRQSEVVVGEELDYLEFLEASTAPEAFESFDRHLAASSHKLNELRSI